MKTRAKQPLSEDRASSARQRARRASDHLKAAGPDHAVLGSQYAYAYLQIAAHASGARYDVAPEEQFTLSVDALLAAVRPDTQIVCAVNPGNPTGTRVANSEIVRLRNELDDDKLLLIDEVDRSDHEFEAYLLEFLSDFQITIPEIGTQRAAVAPVVVLTSNRTRELHEALRRRCVYHWIDYPSPEREAEIVMRRAGAVD